MNSKIPILLSLFTCLVTQAADWPSWRGPLGNNISPETQAPTQWDKTKNIRWRIELPAPGNSSPIVLGNRVFMTQDIEAEGIRQVMCFDRVNGKLLWKKGTVYKEKEKRHDTNTHCAGSPVTDGECVIAHFASAGLFCFDLNGNELWHVDLGKQDHIWGSASSPVIQGNLVLIYHGPGSPSVLHALDKKTGKKVWNVDLPEVYPKDRFDGFAGKTDGMMGSFATPIIAKVNDRQEVILPVSNQVRAFDLKTGKPLWYSEGMNPLVYSSSTFAEGSVVSMGGYFGSVSVVKPGGSGNMTGNQTWYEQRSKKHRIGSPVIYNGRVFIGNTDGNAECLDLATGKQIWLERLKGNGADGETWGSMVLVGDKLYIVNRSGETFVLRAGPAFEVLSINPVAEKSNSTLAVSNGELFLRTHQALWCISETKATASAR